MDKDKILDMMDLFNDINEEMYSCEEWKPRRCQWNQQSTFHPVFPP